MKEALDRARSLLDFISASPTPFHAVSTACSLLSAAGFRSLKETELWELGPGDRCMVTRNDSSIIAFVVGTEPPAKGGFAMVGAHTDSPALKVKPNAELYKAGVMQLGVESYGGLLLSTWLDRDLSLAGRVLLSTGQGALRSVLVDFVRPILRIPNLAIHLDREVNTKGLVLNQQTHMAPVLGLDDERHRRSLRKMLAEQLARSGAADVSAEEIVDHDLFLHDAHKGVIGGIDDSMILAPRIDNLAMAHAALVALIESSAAGAQPHTRVVALWDNEECGSRSAQGAQGPFIRQVLDRVVEAHPDGSQQASARAMARSFLVSADMAHAVHPNYADRHEPAHAPLLGRGPVIKANANQSYASDGMSSAYFVSVCRAVGFEPQRFVMRSDLPCGSTIGPITSALTGIKTVDVGNPMLSMHSVREMAAVPDHATMIAAMGAMFDGRGGRLPGA
ncbi:MAG: M18 family aminopeptidase [Deltaproteobacteria bacterium]|nr:M18 family aminopeptidase [Deltaproteobacteria bacterium]